MNIRRLSHPRKIALLICSALLALHAGTASANSSKPFSNDFVIFETSVGETSSSSASNVATSCRDHIAQVVCLVDPAKKDEDPLQRPCLPGGEAYVSTFEQLYDQYPPVMQQMFCSLKKLWIENEFIGTAFAGVIKDQSGAIMGVRRSVLDEQLDLQTWASWKDQLNFGGVTDSFTLTPSLPHIQVTTQNTHVNDFLYFVVAHEFGHIFDFANDLNRMHRCSEPPTDTNDPECEMSPGTWGSMSWATNKRPLPQEDFLKRTGLCFYWCGQNPLRTTDVLDIYAGLASSTFLSLYGATNPWDEFADSLGYFLLSQNLGATYSIDTRQGPTYDIIAKLHSESFAPKYSFIERFLRRTDLIYP